MLFSIVTITRNHAEGLIRTHKSLTAQICAAYEWIVIDGASRDGTPVWLTTTDALWTSEPDKGIYDAMNKGIARAKGDYLLFLNAGDRLAAPDTLEKIRDAIAAAKTPPTFIYGDAREDVAGGGTTLKKARSPETIAYGMFTHHQAMLYRRDRLDGTRYDTSFHVSADYKFTLQVLRKRKAAVLYCPFPVCVFETGGLSQAQTAQGRAEQFRIRRALGVTPLLHNIRIYLWQTASILFRRAAPGLYWRLRGFWQ